MRNSSASIGGPHIGPIFAVSGLLVIGGGLYGMLALPRESPAPVPATA
ncbi:MAG: hypothetical protein ACLQFR_16695 [Streptosporangiaceae bacterium]